MKTRIRDLAEAFDRSFAKPARSIAIGGANALAVRVCGAPYILRLSEIGLVSLRPKIVPLPNGSPNQLGLAGIRGRLFTVFSLAVLLGNEGASDGWIATVATMRGVAVSFDALEGQTTLADGESMPNVLHLAKILERAGVAP